MGRGGLTSRCASLWNSGIAYASGQTVRVFYTSGGIVQSKIDNNLNNIPNVGSATNFWTPTGGSPNAYLYSTGVTYCTGCTVESSNGSGYISLVANNSGNVITDITKWGYFDGVGAMIFDVEPQRKQYGDPWFYQNFVNAWAAYGKQKTIRCYVGGLSLNSRFTELLSNNSPSKFGAYKTRLHNSRHQELNAHMLMGYDFEAVIASGHPFRFYMEQSLAEGQRVMIESWPPATQTHLFNKGYDIFVPGQSINGLRDGGIAGSNASTGLFNEVVVNLDYNPGYTKNYRGQWASGTQYLGQDISTSSTGDAVINNGKYYWAKLNNTGGGPIANEPGVGAQNGTYWATGYFDYVPSATGKFGNQATGYLMEWVRLMFIHGFSVSVGGTEVFYDGTRYWPINNFIPTGFTLQAQGFYTADNNFAP